MLKVISLLRRAENVSEQEFTRAVEDHTEFARRLPERGRLPTTEHEQP
jgi:hypothetical protein